MLCQPCKPAGAGHRHDWRRYFDGFPLTGQHTITLHDLKLMPSIAGGTWVEDVAAHSLAHAPAPQPGVDICAGCACARPGCCPAAAASAIAFGSQCQPLLPITGMPRPASGVPSSVLAEVVLSCL